ncbi:DUF6779 domain-containing protein [Nocardia cyriacigeorgica]|uniref:DUF6779 domain-containing protein n=1 Tax=Nocardia cyriacigeorgica TaxID=135487 RepID=UPI00245817FB|nr:DUF6779 domain-containing protein [Nocardia cyriacigeorgica]
MVSPSRTSSSPRRWDYAGKLFIGALILLGLVASIFLIFSDSLQFIRIGLVAALWAAVLGALAATKYRKESTIDKAKVRDLQTVYELQLDREISARREYELGVEARVRHEVGADAAEMAALRAELTVLRESLQRLFDGELPMDRPALRADATRVQELTGRPAGSANINSANASGWVGPQQPRDAVTPVYDTDHPQPPIFASPYDDPVTAETSIITLDRDETDATESSTVPTGWADAFAETPADPEDEPAASSWPRADSTEADRSPLVGPLAPIRPGESGNRLASEIVGPPASGASESVVSAPESVGSAPESVASTPGSVVSASESVGSAPESAVSTSGSVVPAPESAASTSGSVASAPESVPSVPEQVASANTASKPDPTPPARPTQPGPTFGSASSRRRRRAESESGESSSKRLSVAEIMANLQSEQRNGSH